MFFFFFFFFLARIDLSKVFFKWYFNFCPFLAHPIMTWHDGWGTWKLLHQPTNLISSSIFISLPSSHSYVTLDIRIWPVAPPIQYLSFRRHLSAFDDRRWARRSAGLCQILRGLRHRFPRLRRPRSSFLRLGHQKSKVGFNEKYLWTRRNGMFKDFLNHYSCKEI